ncbi:hypothetical protein [Hydrocarboniphaga sp.]|uniref:hypothetical protein n=1 Tax=Hydrocarboniphaga sp. TaxID=2033016 RepID=UPI003D1468E5
MKAKRLLFTAVSLLAAAQAWAGSESLIEIDIQRLVQSAHERTTLWPWKPAEPEVAIVAAHGKAAGPLLVARLADKPDDAEDYNVQQQLALALCKIYNESEEGGHIFMNRASEETNNKVKAFWLSRIAEP